MTYIEYVSIVCLHIIFTIIHIPMFQQKIIKKNTKQQEYTVKTIFVIPLMYATYICYLSFIFMMIQYTSKVVFGYALTFVLPFILRFTEYTIYTSMLLICIYWHIEKFSSFTKNWNTFKHESSANQMIVNVSFFSMMIYPLLYYLFNTRLVNITLDRPITNNSKFMLVGCMIVGLLNRLLSRRESKQTELKKHANLLMSKQILYMVSFVSVLMYQ